MKIVELFKKNVTKWDSNDSYDVWISDSNSVYDLGDSVTHLGFINESFQNLDNCNQLIQQGWIKVTNKRKAVNVCGLRESLKSKKNLWLKPILQKYNDDKSITVNLEIFEEESFTFNLPNDQFKLLILL